MYDFVSQNSLLGLAMLGAIKFGSICKNGPTVRTVRCSLVGQLGACYSDLRDLLFGH